MKRLSDMETDTLRRIQREIARLRSEHTMDLAPEEIQELNALVRGVGKFLRAYSDALPGGF